MSRTTKIVMALLALLIVAGGFLTMRLMIASRPEPKKAARENPGALVETLTVSRGQRQVEVHGTGIVQPRQQVEIAPQVSGRAIEVSSRLVAGGFFRQGEPLFRIEDADYRLAVDRAQAALARAEFDLATVAGQARVARQEWESLQLGKSKEPPPLVVYEPQLKNAQAALLSARAALQQAQLDLERTLVRAPFNGIIRSESLDIGQYLRAGIPVAVFAGTDRAEIVVPLPLHELAWLQVPRAGEEQQGSPAKVMLAAGERVMEWAGRIVRSLGDVDPQGRMVRVVVAVDDPYALRASGEERPSLALGSFVEVVLQGEILQNVAVLPAAALRDGEQVWLMNDSHLVFRPVKVVRRARAEVVVSEGLEPGDRVVLTNVAGAAAGMKLRRAAAAGESRP